MNINDGDVLKFIITCKVYHFKEECLNSLK